MYRDLLGYESSCFWDCSHQIMILEPPNLRFSTRLDLAPPPPHRSLLAETTPYKYRRSGARYADSHQKSGENWVISGSRPISQRDVGSDQVCQFLSALLRISRGSMNRVCEGFSTWLSISRAGSRISFGN
jgi:hypothetical protein